MTKFFLVAVFAVPALAGDVDKLAFMSGCWAVQMGPLTIEEQWSRPAGGIMLGASRTLKADKAVFHEFIRIEEREGAILYTPRVGGSSKPVSFKLLQVTANEVVFENPAHDFPQRIIYRRTADGLPARIEGTKNGKTMAEDFPYKRVNCP